MNEPLADDLPLLRAYLDETGPVGAYPSCVCKAVVYRHALESLASPLDVAGLPRILRDHVLHPSPASAWVPTSIVVAVHLTIADRAFGDERRYLDFAYKMTTSLLRTPAYSALFALVGAERLARTGPMRWGAFFRGVDYGLDLLDGGAEGRFCYPPHLIPEILVRAIARAIEAALHCAGAERATVRVISVDETIARTRSEWSPPKKSSFPPPYAGSFPPPRRSSFPPPEPDEEP